ncbi:hypothetical protein SAMN05192534_12017 [Alteribacillus persepolensis]|uniref:Uncharacterized protein n=1 Tax=Alteribacillus persepolensis TaxID=568899 RepID=A0A1G8HHU1_9BACI|nr:hypothetical protein SAMN05192534_12017 [Alteribacillus persepolensis]
MLIPAQRESRLLRVISGIHSEHASQSLLLNKVGRSGLQPLPVEEKGN